LIVMVPGSYASYFVASASASAALIGLLFVAVAVAPERIVGRTATAERRARAGSAFMALLDAFFVSLVALIPQTNIGYVALILGLIALINTLSLGRHVWEEPRGGAGVRRVQQLWLLVGSLVIFGLEVWYAVPLLRQPRDAGAVAALAYLLLATYSVGVGRAWELLGAPDEGLLTLLGIRRASASSAPESQAQGDAAAGDQPPR
jgi:hypothetical protein